MKIKILRDCAIDAETNVKEGKIVDVSDSVGVALIQCGAGRKVSTKVRTSDKE